MQIKFYTISIIGGEKQAEELNAFLRSKKILQTEQQLVQSGQNAFWCFCIKYLENEKESYTKARKERPDYKAILGEASFKIFSELRSIRKAIAKEEAIPAYAVFTDAELAEIAKLGESRSLSQINKIKGIGTKKLEKYGTKFISENETDRTSD